MAQSYWANFAKTGDPNGAGLPVWPRYDPNKDLIFDFHPARPARLRIPGKHGLT